MTIKSYLTYLFISFYSVSKDLLPDKEIALIYFFDNTNKYLLFVLLLLYSYGGIQLEQHMILEQVGW